jgi:Pentapeptide repeats (8 copies)
MHYPKILTKSMVIEGLKNYGIIYDEKSLKNILEPILTSYFHLQSKTSLDLSIDFIHKSFGEYLLAEYYIESILVDGEKVHYLSVRAPTLETVQFLDALLELLNIENENIKEPVNILIKSLGTVSEEQLSQSAVKTILIENAQRAYEDEQIIFQTESFQQQNKIWNIAKFPVSKYHELWIHRWLLLFVLNKLGPEKISNKKMLEVLIQETSHIIPFYLKRMVKLDLSSANLTSANLSYADLYCATLLHANLSFANLTSANLKSTILPVSIGIINEKNYGIADQSVKPSFKGTKKLCV